MDFKKYSVGFTLLELMLVVIITGILAGIAIPGYQKAVEKGYGDQAKVILQVCYTAEKLYRLDHNTYDSIANLVNGNYIDDPNSGGPKFDYTTESTSSTFTIKATRNSGPYSGKYLTIDEDGPVQWTWPY